MNLYCLTVNGDKEYVSGNTPIQALKFYCEEFGWDIKDFSDSDVIFEINKDLWSTIKIKNTEYSKEKNSVFCEYYTFYDLMKDVKEPQLIATSYE